MRRLIAAVGVALVVLALTLGAGDGPGSAARLPGQRPIPLDRVSVLVLENRSWGQIIGNPDAPYLNSLARRGAVETDYYAITHPSLPNYLALTTGGHKNINHDCTACRSSGRSLANQLETAHISWRAYFESLRNPL
ncbi:MAG: alkaline phosphatase family protein, partial [Thermoleophilaceae bacterium]